MILKRFANIESIFTVNPLNLDMSKKESLYFKPSSLYCVIYLSKNSVVYYHLTDLIPYLEYKVFQPCYFWCIESPGRLASCFQSLLDTLENVISQLSSSSLDEGTFFDALINNYKAVYSIKDKDLDFSKIECAEDYAQSYFLSLQNTRDGYLFSRYSNFAPYTLLLKNKVDKALIKYEKLNQKGKLLDYEKSLIRHISGSQNGEFFGFDPACDSADKAEKLLTPLAFLRAFLIVYPVASFIFCGCFALYNLIISIDTIIVLCAPWYMGFLCAGFCSVFGAIAFLTQHPHPNRHLNKEEQKNLLKVLVSKSLNKFILIIFAISVSVSIFFAVMIMIPSIKFYDDRVAFYGNTYSYNDINSVYYISARYNVYGDRVERGSYVILFDDKTSLDLDGFASVKLTEREVLPLLKGKGFDVKFADSEKELPWYTVE